MTRGSLETVGDRWRLRFVRSLRHPPDRVWTALTDPDELAAWFPQRVETTWTVGGPVTFGSEPNETFTGEVLRSEPPRLLEYTWGTDVLRFEIEPSADGCVLTLLDTFTERGKGARDAAGWHVCLDALEAAIAGTALGDFGTRWAAVHPDYVSAFGPEAATIGPPG